MQNINETNYNKRVGIITLGISGLVAFATIASLAFAYLSANFTNSTNVQFNAKMSNQVVPVFVAVPSGNLTMYASTANLLTQVSNSTVAASSSQNFNITLTGGGAGSTVRCDFDFLWQNLGDNYEPSAIAENEYTMQIFEGSNEVLAETNMNHISLAALENNGSIASSSLSSSGTTVTKTYLITVKIYNAVAAQTGITNKHFSSKVTVDNVVCT